MRRRGRTSLVATLAVAAVGLTSCVGIGAVDHGGLTAEAQRRGGGVTTGLVDDAVAALAEATGEDPLQVHSITAALTVVTIVVPAADGSGGREQWRYGTSGLYGGRGLTGPDVAAAPAPAPFPVAVGDLDVDGAVATATAEAGARAGSGSRRWVESVTVARPAEGAEPVTTVVVTDGGLPTPVLIDADGDVIPEGLR